jgi:hypothetical protein
MPQATSTKYILNFFYIFFYLAANIPALIKALSENSNRLSCFDEVNTAFGGSVFTVPEKQLVSNDSANNRSVLNELYDGKPFTKTLCSCNLVIPNPLYNLCLCSK